MAEQIKTSELEESVNVLNNILGMSHKYQGALKSLNKLKTLCREGKIDSLDLKSWYCAYGKEDIIIKIPSEIWLDVIDQLIKVFSDKNEVILDELSTYNITKRKAKS